MRIRFLSEDEPVAPVAGRLSRTDRLVIGLAAAGEVQVSIASTTLAERTRAARATAATAVASDDIVVTAGWAGLLASELLGIVSDLHFLEDFELPVGVPGWPSPETAGERVELRKLALLNRARRIVAATETDQRRLRAWGRFAAHLDPAAEDPAHVTALAKSIPPRDQAEISIADALAAASAQAIDDLSGLLDACFGDGSPTRIQTVNLQHVYLARQSVVFREAIATADAITADGWPIVKLINSTGRRVKRTTGADLVPMLLSDPRISGMTVALVGGAEPPGAAFEQLVAKAGGRIVFRDHGDKRDWDPRALAAELNESGAHLALIAVTQPAGDLLAKELIDAGYRGTAIGVGAAVELFVGGERRAAPLVQRMGLEWLYRFAQDPKRLWRRYLLEGVPTYLRVVRPLTVRHALRPPARSDFNTD